MYEEEITKRLIFSKLSGQGRPLRANRNSSKCSDVKDEGQNKIKQQISLFFTNQQQNLSSGGDENKP